MHLVNIQSVYQLTVPWIIKQISVVETHEPPELTPQAWAGVNHCMKHSQALQPPWTNQSIITKKATTPKLKGVWLAGQRRSLWRKLVLKTSCMEASNVVRWGPDMCEAEGKAKKAYGPVQRRDSLSTRDLDCTRLREKSSRTRAATIGAFLILVSWGSASFFPNEEVSSVILNPVAELDLEG